MKIEVSSYCGIVGGAVEIDRVTLLAGRNRAGKSSFCRAAAAAITGASVPHGVTKKSAEVLVNSASDEGTGHARVVWETGAQTVLWSKGDSRVASEGTGLPPKSSHVSAGLVSFVDGDKKLRRAILSEHLQVLPTSLELAAALDEAGISPLATTSNGKETVHIAVIRSVEKIGWDLTHDSAKEAAIKAKGAWEAATRARYGSKVAASWRPDGWSESVGKLTIAQAEAEVEAAAEHAKAMHAEYAGGAISVEEAKRELDELAKIIATEEDVRTAAANAHDAVRRAIEHETRLPPAGGDSGTPCPHCGGLIRVAMVSGCQVLEPGAAAMSKEEHTARATAINEAARVVRVAQAHARTADIAVAKVEQAIAKYDEISAKVAQAPDVRVASDAVRAAEAEEVAARRQLAMVRTAVDARQAAERAEMWTTVARVLSPEGARAKKLESEISAVNEIVARLAADASWPAPKLNAEMELFLGDRRPEVVWSGSERWRANVLLQLVLAAAAGDEVAIIDGADILDASGRNGLFSMLAKVRVKVLVAMTLNKPAACPDLDGAGLGKSFWIDEGFVSSLSEATKPAAK